MNRFSIAPGREEEFERVWRERESHLDQVPGFKEFRLLRGVTGEEVTLFISHSIWTSRAAFVAWTESEAFLKAHRRGKSPEGLVLKHPDFEGYEVVDM